MNLTIDPRPDLDTGETAADRMLTATLLAGPMLSLAADTTYAVRGWDDATAGSLHILASILYGLVVVRVATWLGGRSPLAGLLLLTAIAGAVGNSAYGFDAIHQSLGDPSLVDQSGAANIIKPLGLLFPLALALVAAGLRQLGHRWPAGLVLLGSLAWPVAHIGNIAPLAVATNVALVVGLGTVGWGSRPAAISARA